MAQLIVLPVTSRTSPQPVPTLCLEGIQNISLTVISKYSIRFHIKKVYGTVLQLLNI